jgi:GH15 family glucan-1,4-alpha-glucosidase
MRVDGYASIGDYAALGDGRTVALVARDGQIDWLAVPAIDKPTVFGALLDAGRGGHFRLAPTGDYEVERRYLPETNVLETTYTTADGVAVVEEALALQDGGLLSWIELVRRIRGEKGRVAFRYELLPRFDFGRAEPTIERHRDAIEARAGSQILSFRTWEAGQPTFGPETIAGELETSSKTRAVLVAVIVDGEPVPYPPRDEVETRFERTVDAWRRWATFHDYESPYNEAVTRSALALKLLIYATSGAVAAAPTTSLPEWIGGSANYDYRFAWVRDSAFTLDALGNLGYSEQVHESLSWLLDASGGTHPRLEPFYALDGTVPTHFAELDLDGYRGTKPVRLGNGAAGQTQLGSYGDLLETICLYVQHGNALDPLTKVRVAEVADHVCRIWQNEDSGIWELPVRRHYTESKLSCWVVLDRAIRLAELGEAPAERVGAWREEAERIRAWTDEHCWSEARNAFAFYAGTDELDASVLLAARTGYLAPDDPRLGSTIDAIRQHLGAGGPLLYRYSGQEGKEGCFLACSFWLADALARAGRLGEAREVMDALLGLANDVGLYSEEIDPRNGELLGNFPQGLTHLSLINAAKAIADSEERER